MIDPLTAAAIVVAAAVALAAAGVAWRLHRRVRHVEGQAAHLHQQLAAERHVANHDPLTGLPNRRAFFRRGTALLAGPNGYSLVAVVLDVDGFKEVNDRLGHAAGDEILVAIARRLAAFAGDNLVARLGGDEFAGLLAGPAPDRPALRHMAAALTEAVGAPVRVARHQLSVRVSVGVAAVPAGTGLADVLQHADAAMYRAKTYGRAGQLAPVHGRSLDASSSFADWSATTMPIPTIDPDQRDPAGVAPADSYRHADPVWVYRADTWRAGVVEIASPQAVTVTYRPSNTRGTGVDTLTAPYLLPREDVDPLLDHELR